MTNRPRRGRSGRKGFRCYMLALAGLLLAGGARAAQPAPPPQQSARLDSLANDFVVRGRSPGLSVFVLKGQDTLLARGYGYADLENDVPVTPRTVFRIGSVTKSLTATAVLQQVQEDGIALDDTVRRFLPQFPTQGHRVTIEHLLTHTSGIRSFTAVDGYDPNLDAPLDSVLAVIARQPFDFPPGERFLYNNSGYFLLGMILQQATGRDYDDVIRGQLSAALGLDDTRYCFLRPIISRRAAGYTIDDGGFVNARFNAMSQPFAAGGLCSTAPDLVTWARALFSGAVVEPALLGAMTTPARLNDGSATRYGFGFWLGSREDRRNIGHGGGINGFTSVVEHYPDDDLTIVVLANANTDLSELVTSFVRVVLGQA